MNFEKEISIKDPVFECWLLTMPNTCNKTLYSFIRRNWNQLYVKPARKWDVTHGKILLHGVRRLDPWLRLVLVWQLQKQWPQLLKWILQRYKKVRTCPEANIGAILETWNTKNTLAVDLSQYKSIHFNERIQEVL